MKIQMLFMLQSLILWNDIYPRSNLTAINHVQMRAEFLDWKRKKKSNEKKMRRLDFHFDGLICTRVQCYQTNQAIRGIDTA